MVNNLFAAKNRILLRELIITDFKLRYQGSALGYAWSMLKPLFLFAILYVVFNQFLKLGRDIEHFPVYLLLGIVLWGFFTEATTNGLNAIIARGDLIRKINFPRYIIVISGTVSALINLAFNLVVVFVFILLNGVHISPMALLVVPLIIELYVFALGLAFFLSALNVKLRDIGYLWDIFLQAAFYATPIIYPVAMVVAESPLAAKLIMLNPIAQTVQDIRYVLVTQDSITLYQLVSGWKVLIPFVIVIVTSIFGVWYFKKRAKTFAEDI
ncbi:ABC transporter permease [Candidatus Mycosynbacter amalyticus]|uniref:Transport permease protein n=1 Tax=Candidatus Mycosynbacter amalyticus TaxID=2665156 RepID=A0A857ML37_9BACT|nr:ABC transporter permease [Candidatus Mycosynbacter amalyticus]QHN43334.1 ABC transporter permease [Candidatus Mycosynbacter amalyticus]